MRSIWNGRKCNRDLDDVPSGKVFLEANAFTKSDLSKVSRIRTDRRACGQNSFSIYV